MANLSPRRPFGWLLLALLLGAAAAFAADTPREASAHALLVRADPPVNASVPQPPSQLTLYFSESLERRFSSARVTDQDGRRVEQSIEFDDTDDRVMRVNLAALSPGYISVVWENVSAVDGHRISGSYPLTILNPDGSPPPGSPPSSTVEITGEEAKPARVVNRFVLIVSVVAYSGALAFLLWVVPALPLADSQREAFMRRLRLLLLGALGVLLLSGLIDLVLQANDIGASIGETLDTQWGERWALRNVILALSAFAFFALLSSTRLRRIGGLIGLFGALAYLLVVSSVSHAAAGEGAFWAVASDFIHLLTASVWLGMLAALVLLFFWTRSNFARGDRYPVLATALQRFSVAAFLSLSLLLFSGVVSAVIEVSRLSDLIDTGYGQTLLLKLILIVPLLGLAGTNAYVFRPDYVETSESTASWARARLEELEQALFRTMRFELLAALAVLAVVALLVQLTPTRGQEAATQTVGPFTGTSEAEGIAVTFVIDPNQPGINTFSVYLSGAVNTIESVRLNFFPPRGDADLTRLVMDASNPPTFYIGRGPFIAEGGRWRIEVDLRRNTGSDLAIPFTIRNVPGAGGAPTTEGRGGDFAAPVELTPPRLASIAVSGLFVVGLVIGSIPREGLPAGYLGRVAENVLERVGPIRPRPAFSLLALVAIGIGLGLVLGSHLHNPVTPEEASQGNPIASSPESVERGRQIFLSSCIQCHGESGRGDGPLARTLPIPPANLYDHVPYHPDQFFFQVISNGLSGVMPAFGTQLSEDDRWHVLNFLRDRFGQPVPEQ